MQPLMTAPEPQHQTGKQESRSGLWSEAPGFRRLVISAAAVTIVAAAVQLAPVQTPPAPVLEGAQVAPQQAPPVTGPVSVPAAPVAPLPPAQMTEAAPPILPQPAHQEPPAMPVKPAGSSDKAAAVHNVRPHPAAAKVPSSAAIHPPIQSAPTPAPAPQRQEQTAMLPAEGTRAVPQQAPLPSQIPSRECGPEAKYNSEPSAGGVVVGFLLPEQAQWVLQKTQSHRGMLINPEYLANKRAMVRVGGGSGGPQVIAVVPWGMQVNVGDNVHFIGNHVDPSMACHYVPNLIDSAS